MAKKEAESVSLSLSSSSLSSSVATNHVDHSVAAATAVDDDGKEYSCPVCYDDYTKPFMTPCSKNHDIYFHSNAYGRMRHNVEKGSKASFECFKSGKLLPSNLALEMSFQYECVIAFGVIKVVTEMNEKKEILNGLLKKYFGDMEPNKDYRAITNTELNQTSVYRFKIKNWSGKRNWEEKAEQAEDNEWPDLNPKWFNFY